MGGFQSVQIFKRLFKTLSSKLGLVFIVFSLTDTVLWLQGITHIHINSTVDSRIPVHVAWYFRYYQVSGIIAKHPVFHYLQDERDTVDEEAMNNNHHKQGFYRKGVKFLG